jgi:hypothetical protein
MNWIVKTLGTLLDAGYRVIKFMRFDSDTQTADQALPFGIDSVPVKDLYAVYMETSVQDDNVIIGYLNPNALAQLGDLRLFATNASGTEQARIWIRNDGKIELGGTGARGTNVKHATQYEALETAFNQLKSDFNDLVTKYNAHTHAYLPGPGASAPTAPTTSTETPSTADITGAKLNNILTE